MGKTSGPSRSELLKGTLDMLILQTLTMQPLHGYAIAQQIELLSDAVLTVEQGSLYPALERLQRQRLQDEHIERALEQLALRWA